MRRIANINNPRSDVVRVMLYQDYTSSVFVFEYTSLDDGPCKYDRLFDDLEQAEQYCLGQFNIALDDWQNIDDPNEGCQDDWIAPVRVKGRHLGRPVWGSFEQLIDGVWQLVVCEKK
jgi:hypothetical protein